MRLLRAIGLALIPFAIIGIVFLMVHFLEKITFPILLGVIFIGSIILYYWAFE